VETWGFQFVGKLGVSTLVEFRVSNGMKLGVYNKLTYSGGMSSGEELEITYFVDVVEDGSELRWGRM
jgi:hypothetical protein